MSTERGKAMFDAERDRALAEKERMTVEESDSGGNTPNQRVPKRNARME